MPVVPVNFAAERRAWSDDTHLAAQDIDHLWEFVDAVPADKSTDTGDSWILTQLEQHTVAVTDRGQFANPVVSAVNHAAELEHLKWFAVQPDSLCAVEDRAAALQFDCDRSGDQDR